MNLPYSVEQFEADISEMKPRPFDTYILPAFLILYAVRSKNAMGRWMRRILFTSGIFMAYRNWSEYKALVANMRQQLPELPEGGEIIEAIATVPTNGGETP